MYNIVQKVNGTTLVLEIDISPKSLKAAPPSSTGKTNLVASTQGKQDLTGGISYALNVMVRRTP